MADRTTRTSEPPGDCRECLVGWQMCFLAHGSGAFQAGRKCLGNSELAGRFIGLHCCCVVFPIAH